MISRDYHIRYHKAYFIVYHRFLPKTYIYVPYMYTKLFSIKGFCFCCCCFQCNFPYLIVCIRAWFAGYGYFSYIPIFIRTFFVRISTHSILTVGRYPLSPSIVKTQRKGIAVVVSFITTSAILKYAV
jgi:hypothetical protein